MESGLTGWESLQTEVESELGPLSGIHTIDWEKHSSQLSVQVNYNTFNICSWGSHPNSRIKFNKTTLNINLFKDGDFKPLFNVVAWLKCKFTTVPECLLERCESCRSHTNGGEGLSLGITQRAEVLITLQISHVSISLIAPNCPLRGTQFFIMGAL